MATPLITVALSEHKPAHLQQQAAPARPENAAVPSAACDTTGAPPPSVR